MLQTCFCNGCIEDCDYCYGTGLRKVGLARPARATKIISRRCAHDRQRCGFCGEWTTSLEEHTAERHPGHRPATWRAEPRQKVGGQAPAAKAKIAVPRIAGPALAPGETEKQKGDRCPECEQRVTGLVAHLLRDHGWRTVDGVVSQPSEKSRALVLCPDCRSPVRRDRLDQHRQRIHGRRVPARRKANSVAAPRARDVRGRKAGKPSRKQAHGSARRTLARGTERVYAWDGPVGLSLEEMRREREADATREYAHTYRERGRFGSHAVHDDYGDESGS